MIVDNLTSKTYILSGGYILEGDQSGLEILDADYQSDSTLNNQIDALDIMDQITVTDKPSDPFTDSTSLPDQWTVDEFGNLLIEPSQESEDFAVDTGGIFILAPNDATDAFLIGDQESGEFNLGIDPFGFILSSGADFSTNTDELTLRVAANRTATLSAEPPVTPTQDVVQFRVDFGSVGNPDPGDDEEHAGLVRLTKDGDFLYQIDGDPLFKVSAADGSVHIKTGTSIIADL